MRNDNTPPPPFSSFDRNRILHLGLLYRNYRTKIGLSSVAAEQICHDFIPLVDAAFAEESKARMAIE